MSAPKRKTARQIASARVDRLLIAAIKARKESPGVAKKKALLAADAAEAFANKYGGDARELWRARRALDFYRRALKREQDERRDRTSAKNRRAIDRTARYR